MADAWWVVLLLFLKNMFSWYTLMQSLTRCKKARSRRERETWKQFLRIREEKEKSKFPFTNFEKRKRNPNSFASSREEKEKSRMFLPSFERRKRNQNSFSQFREEKEKSRIPLPSFEKRKRNWQIYQTFEKRNLKQNSYMDISIYESRKRHFKCW